MKYAVRMTWPVQQVLRARVARPRAPRALPQNSWRCRDGEHFPLSARDPAAVASWFGDYRATNVRLFTYPRPTVAAAKAQARCRVEPQ
jgi:hypothetical protein